MKDKLSYVTPDEKPLASRNKPMDYDDNDFQSQNLHLAGEGSAKFPPVLRQYALPKFDFDDTLQGHVRFDSLVEAEVFLGIENNEDNQWIEDYSRGSSGIGFSSCAAESCSTLRRKNVWSEATSSESVEMLLKSVGQEDISLVQAFTGESNACDKLNCLTKPMDPTLKDDGSSFCEMGDLQPTLLPEMSLEELSGVEQDTRGEQPQSDDTAEVRKVGSVDDPTVVLEIVEVPAIEGNLVIDENSKQTSQSTTDMSVSMSLEENVKDDFSALGEHINDLVTCTQTGGGKSSYQKIQQQINDLCGKDSVGAHVDDLEQVVNSHELGSEDQNNLLSASVVEERLVVDSSIGNIQSCASITLKEDSIFHSENGESMTEIPAETAEFDDKVLFTSTSVEIGNPSEANMDEVLPMDLQGDTRIEACAGEENNTNAEVHAVQGSNMNSVGQMAYAQEIILEEKQSLPLGVEIHFLKPESSASAQEETNISKVGESINDMSSLTDVHGACAAPRENSYSDGDMPSSSLAEATQLWEENKLCRVGDVHLHTEDVSVSEKEDAGLSSDSVSVSGRTTESPITNKRIESSSFQESGGEINMIDSKLDYGHAGNESVSVSTIEDVGKATCDTSVSTFEDANVATCGTLPSHTLSLAVHKEVRLPPTVPRFNQPERKEENAVTVASEASFPLLDAPQPVVESHPCSQPETADCAIKEYESHEIVDHSISKNLNNDDCSKESQDVPQAEITNDTSQDCRQEMNVDPVFCEPTVKACDSVIKKSDAESVPINDSLVTQCLPPLGETLGTDQKSRETAEVTSESVGINCQKAIAVKIDCDAGKSEGSMSSTVPRYHAKSSVVESVSSTDADKPTPDSPHVKTIVISHDTFQKECSKGPSTQNVEVLEANDTMGDNVWSGSKDPNKNSVSESEIVPTVESSSLVGLQKIDTVESSPFQKECAKGPSTQNVEVLEANGTMVDNVWSGSQDPNRNGVSESEIVPTVESSPLVGLQKIDSGTSGQSFSVAPAACQTSLVVEVSQSFSGPLKTDVKSGQDISHGSTQVSEVNVVHARSKSTPERKPRRASTKGSGKGSSTKGSHVKKSEKVEKSKNLPASNPGIFQLVQSNEMQHHGHVESSGAKPFVFIGTSSSSIPDLNNSASTSPLFQQPFTDLQQVQLRAQIFVYGALIQGTAPDEAYMLSAFGGLDGGTNLWESAWRMCIDRLHGKKSHPSNPETPLPSQPGRSTEQANKQSALQSKVISPPVSRISSKSTPTTVNPMIPLSSPLWSISTPSNALQSSFVPRSPIVDYQQAHTPLHPYQTPPARNFIGHNFSWFSQAPFHSSWVAPQTSAPDSGVRFSGLPITEPVHLTPLKESSMPQSSAAKPSGSAVLGGAPGNVLSGASPVIDLKKMSVTTGQNPTDSKLRRRKRITVSEDPGQMAMQAQPQLKPVPAVVTTTISTLATSPSVHSKAASENLNLSASPLCSTTHLKNTGHDVRGRAILSEETLGKVRETMQLAEDAALFASEAIKHSGEVWSQLDRQKSSELISDVEAKVASAAIAIAAAAAVAKAAAAAASVASNAAFQAKLMADEALTSSGHELSCQNNEISIHGSAVGVGKATPASILRGEGGGNGSSSIIVVAREAARKRVEAASAASKHAENMDAIVRAAELAAAAVSQAGKIVAMGDPLPLRKLVEAGPEGYWKVSQVSPELVTRIDDVNRECANSSIKHPREGSSGKNEIQASANVKSSIPSEISMGSVENHPRLVDGITSSVTPREKDRRGHKDQNVTDLTKTIGVVPESELGPRSSQNEYEKAKDLEQSSIKEGSHVEVFKDGNGLIAAWFTANVLSLKEGKAYVGYTELQPEEGSGQLKEWVALDGQGDMPPRIRLSRPITTLRNEGTRKRRRAAAGDYIWSVGDKVDVWMQNSWHEGVVAEKDAKDESTYTVRFPARGETLAVKAWSLRPSLVWKDGQWFESSSSYGNDYSHEIVVPREKRMKLGSSAAEVKGKEKMPTILEDVESLKPAESSLLVLSANEKVFNVGRNTQTETKSNSLKTSRTGLQKGASRVIFGVPKPGKKRKFMEVSKHYVADSSRSTEENDSVKLVKYLMPQGASKGLKRTSKFESKEKRSIDSKPMGVKSGKQPGVLGKSISQKESRSANISAGDDSSTEDHALVTESQVENASGKNNPMDVTSFVSIEGAADGPILFPSSHAPKKASSFGSKPERANKGKLAPAVGKLAKIEEDRVFNGNQMKSNSNVIEPRRSNRRIQPTSRLLEGLQSSLTISKIPSISYDKGHRSQNRNSSRGNRI